MLLLLNSFSSVARSDENEAGCRIGRPHVEDGRQIPHVRPDVVDRLRCFQAGRDGLLALINARRMSKNAEM